jgi:hypothetical protein
MKNLRLQWKDVLDFAKACDMKSVLQQFKFIVENEARSCDFEFIETAQNSERLRRECHDIMTVDEQGMKVLARILEEQCTCKKQ